MKHYAKKNTKSTLKIFVGNNFHYIFGKYVAQKMQFSGKSQFSQKTQRARNGSHHATENGKKAARFQNFLKANLLSQIVLKLFLSSDVYLAFIETSPQCCLYLADV